MGNYARPHSSSFESDSMNASRGKPDPRSFIAPALAEWVAKRQMPLPHPCPRDFIECSEWWMREMQEPEGPSETYRTSTGDGKEKWHVGYALRTRAALLRFLDLPEADRAFIVAARKDGVWWRGDPMPIFQSIYEQTAAMRKGVEAYKNEAMLAAKRVSFSFSSEA